MLSLGTQSDAPVTAKRSSALRVRLSRFGSEPDHLFVGNVPVQPGEIRSAS
jgi:hypothetical protein